MVISKPNKRIPGRVAWIIVICLIAAGILIYNLFQLQVVNYQEYLEKVLDNVQRETTVTGSRGNIYDRNGFVLATNYTVYRVFISPRDFLVPAFEGSDEKVPDEKKVNLVADKLSELLDVDKEMILERAAKITRADETIKKNVEEETAKQILTFIRENDLNRQIHLEPAEKRYYPYGDLAAQVIGIVGTDGGLFGIEMQYDSYLRGSTDRYVTAKNGSSLDMPYSYNDFLDAADGGNVYLTIDIKIQQALERQLRATYNDSMPLNRVTGIVMDPSDASVLAMATYPAFDLNDPYRLTDEYQAQLDALHLDPESKEYNEKFYELVYAMWRNKAVSELYEPGSTFKVITTSSALESGTVNLGTHFNCTGVYTVADRDIHCHALSGHGNVDFSEALQQSCNPSMMEISARMGRDLFYDYFKAFGYTEKCGIDLPGEAGSVYHAKNGFGPVELAVYSFGQTFKVAAIQHLTSLCSVANGGYLLTPYIVSEVRDNAGGILYEHVSSVRRQVVSTATCRTIAGILEEGVSGDGGAKNAYVAGYRIAAKTGTSEVRDKVNPVTGAKDYRVGSTAAFAPYDDPRVAAVIIVDEPQCENVYGSVIAAPYIANLMAEILPQVDVERVYTAEEMAKLAIAVKDYENFRAADAQSDILSSGLAVEIVGNGDYVVSQLPKSGVSLSRENGKIILFTGDAKPEATVYVPNVVGMTLDVANKTLSGYGLNIVVQGANNGSGGAKVVDQSLPEGEIVPRGTAVTITLRYLDGTAN